MSILFSDRYDNRNIRASSGIYYDLNIDKLLDERFFNILSLECTKEEIMYRQDIFLRLLNDDLYNVFCELRNLLANLESNFYIYDKSDSLLEQIFRARNVCLDLVGVYECVSKIKANENKHIQKLKSDIQVLTKTINIIKELSDETKDDFEQFSRARVKLSGGQAIIASHGNDGWLTRFIQLANNIGIAINDSKAHTRNIKLNEYFASSYYTCHKQTADKLKKFISIVKVVNRDILRYRNEIEFYIAIYLLVIKLQNKGIPWSIPKISKEKCFFAKNLYDISLTANNVDNIVPNDVFLSEKESLFFITGANGGGKTSYLRAVATNSLFATAGCPVFAEIATTFSFNKIFTHFPKDETFTDSGRFVEEKARITSILSQCENNDLIFLNETFSGTDIQKGSAETEDVAQAIIDKGSFGLIVTHFAMIQFDKYSVLSAYTNADGERTFKITRGDERINAHASDILKKYKLSRNDLKHRLERRTSNDS